MHITDLLYHFEVIPTDASKPSQAKLDNVTLVTY